MCWSWLWLVAELTRNVSCNYLYYTIVSLHTRAFAWLVCNNIALNKLISKQYQLVVGTTLVTTNSVYIRVVRWPRVYDSSIINFRNAETLNKFTVLALDLLQLSNTHSFLPPKITSNDKFRIFFFYKLSLKEMFLYLFCGLVEMGL